MWSEHLRGNHEGSGCGVLELVYLDEAETLLTGSSGMLGVKA